MDLARTILDVLTRANRENPMHDSYLFEELADELGHREFHISYQSDTSGVVHVAVVEDSMVIAKASILTS